MKEDSNLSIIVLSDAGFEPGPAAGEDCSLYTWGACLDHYATRRNDGLIDLWSIKIQIKTT